MIEAWHVREALRPRFGSALVDVPGIWDKAASLLQNYAPYRDSFPSLAARLEDVIFNTVYEQLGPSMGARMEDGAVRRLRSAEMKDAADDVLGLLFENLKIYSVNYDALHDYAMTTGSPAAIRVLCEKYQSFMPQEELRMMERVLRERSSIG